MTVDAQAPSSIHSALYQAADSSCCFLIFFFFFPRKALCFAEVKKRLYPLPLHTQCHPPLLIHTHTQQTHAPAARDEGQGRMGPWKDICKLMASPKQARALWRGEGARPQMKESYQKWQLDWL